MPSQKPITHGRGALSCGSTGMLVVACHVKVLMHVVLYACRICIVVFNKGSHLGAALPTTCGRKT